MKEHWVAPGTKLDLSKVDAGSTAGADGGKQGTAKALDRLASRLESLQEQLWAEHRHKVLIVLQGMDTSGKDGTISHVFEGVNPLGVRVAAFKAPAGEELEHDFLWRVHQRVPGHGEMVIFNRSHYESVLVERVQELTPPAVWKLRYQQINDFERLLAESGTTILKFFLHIDKAEQKKRLEARLADPEKRWKFRRGDLDDRKRWDEYMDAYEEAIRRTSTANSPWYIVPANKKWYRNLVVATVLVETLEKLGMKTPQPAEDLAGIVVD